jgi:hypothetical protein
MAEYYVLYNTCQLTSSYHVELFEDKGENIQIEM